MIFNNLHRLVAGRTLARISEEKHFSHPEVRQGGSYGNNTGQERAMSLDDAEHRAAEVLKLQEALKMLYDLLEEHAPSWYTEKHHDKAEAALRLVKK